MERQMARDIARSEISALTSALTDAAGAVLFADDLSADEVGAGLRDVVSIFSSEIDRRINGWIDVDPEPTVETEKENDMNLSEKDKAAVVIAKAARQNPELKERMQRVDETRAAREPFEKMHPLSRISEDSPVITDFEPEILAKMSAEKCSAEIAIGLLCKDEAFHVMKTRYREEMRARGA